MGAAEAVGVAAAVEVLEPAAAVETLEAVGAQPALKRPEAVLAMHPLQRRTA
jgi:hypothetical protein